MSLSLSDICHVADKDVPKLDNLIGTMDFGSHALNAPQDHDTLQTCKCKYESLRTTSPDSEEQTTERALGLWKNKKNCV